MIVGGVFCIISALTCIMRIRHVKPDFNK